MRLVQVLGPGCPNCAKLAERARAAVGELGVEAEVEKVTDMGRIMEFGIMMTPGLAIDGEVKVVGRVPSAEEIKEWLAE